MLPFLVAATAGCAVIKSIKSEMTDHVSPRTSADLRFRPTEANLPVSDRPTC